MTHMLVQIFFFFFFAVNCCYKISTIYKLSLWVFLLAVQEKRINRNKIIFFLQLSDPLRTCFGISLSLCEQKFTDVKSSKG